MGLQVLVLHGLQGHGFYLLIKRLKPPDATTSLVYLIPPSEPHQYSATHVLYNPEVNSEQHDCHYKVDDITG